MTRKYPEVRALSRGLKIMSALSELGPSHPARLCEVTGIDRTTVYRLLHTLELNGFVQSQPNHLYILSPLFGDLATGLTQGDRFTQIAFPFMEALTHKSGWPCDFAIWSGGTMQIRASTHHLTSMTFFRRLVGKTRPVLTTALGQAFLTACSPDKRSAILAQASALEGWDLATRRARIDAIIKRTSDQGYASCISTYDRQISAIALPVGNGAVPIGAINIVYFRAAMSLDSAVAAYLDDLRTIARTIEESAIPGALP